MMSNDELLLEGFQEFQFSPRPDRHVGGVYVWTLKTRNCEVPFYVGMTTRFFGRLDDYFWASPQAPSDFRVGEAIRFFTDYFAGNPDIKVAVHYKHVEDPRAEETKLLTRFQGRSLINGMKSISDIEHARLGVHKKCLEILVEAGLRSAGNIAGSDAK